MRYFRLYILRLKYSFKVLLNSMTNFIIGFLAFLCIQLSAIIFINITFSKIPSIEGYTFYQVMALYGFSQISKGLDHFYSDYLWHISMSTIKRGLYDKFMLRPINTYFQVIVEKVQFDALGEILVGILIYYYGLKGLNIVIDFRIVSISLFFVILGSIVYTALKTISASFAFILKDSYFVIKLIYSISDFSKYPITIYPVFLQVIMTYIIAFAVTAYYPIEIILFRYGYMYYLKILLVIFILVIFAIISWRKGEQAYESSGA